MNSIWNKKKGSVSYKCIVGKFLCLCLMASVCSACNEFDDSVKVYLNPQIPTEEPVVPPTIDASWKLEPLKNANKRVFVYKDKKFDGLFTRTLGWNGGDGVYSAVLPDGNTFWSFCDSFYGVVDGETRARRECSFPRNSLMIQVGEENDEDLVWLADYVQTTDPKAPRYYQARTHLRHPLGEKTEEEIQRGDIDQKYVYWTGDATIYKDNTGKEVLQVIWGGTEIKGDMQFGRTGTCLATYSLEGVPGDDTYMKLLSVNHDFKKDTYAYGSTLYEDEDGHIYLYDNFSKDYDHSIIVARTQTHDLNSPWEYYVGDSEGSFRWQKTVPTRAEAELSSIAKNGVLANVFEKDGFYYMVTQAPFFQHSVYIQRSEHPYGPFKDSKLLFTVPNTIDKLGNKYYKNLYNIFMHSQFSRNGELVFSTNTDAFEFGDNFNKMGSADIYRPFFFRVYNWESLYGE